MDDLTAELIKAHEQAGRPSARSLAKHAGCSHTTIAEALNGKRIPSLHTLLGIVQALNGDLDLFEALYPEKPAPEPPPKLRLLEAILKELQTIRQWMESH